MRNSCLSVRSQPARPNTRAAFLVPPARAHVRRIRDQKNGKDLSINQLMNGFQGFLMTHALHLSKLFRRVPREVMHQELHIMMPQSFRKPSAVLTKQRSLTGNLLNRKPVLTSRCISFVTAKADRTRRDQPIPTQTDGTPSR